MRGLLVWLLLTAPAFAGEVTVQLPDAQLREAMVKARFWYHCQPDWTDAECLTTAMNSALELVTFGHKNLDTLGATVTHRYDEEGQE